MANSTKRQKPSKPYPTFPLGAANNGQWQKKIKGKIYYFGIWEDPDAALAKYTADLPFILKGQKPPSTGDGGRHLSLQDVSNLFLEFQEKRVRHGQLTNRAFKDYKDAAQLLVDCLGKSTVATMVGPVEFDKLMDHFQDRYNSPNSIGNRVTRIRSIFRWAVERDHLPKLPKFGSFTKPSRKDVRKHRQSQTEDQMLHSHEIRELLDGGNVHDVAKILLCINCAFGPSDIGHLEFRHLDLVRGWVELPRSKTCVERACPLWPETIKALHESIEARKEPKDLAHKNRVFITDQGQPWHIDRDGDSKLTKRFAELFDYCGINRPGVKAYGLRRAFATVASELEMPIATNFIMGHLPPEDAIPGMYRQGPTHENLRKITNHVRKWLFPPKTRKKRKAK